MKSNILSLLHALHQSEIIVQFSLKKLHGLRSKHIWFGFLQYARLWFCFLDSAFHRHYINLFIFRLVFRKLQRFLQERSRFGSYIGVETTRRVIISNKMLYWCNIKHAESRNVHIARLDFKSYVVRVVWSKFVKCLMHWNITRTES